MTPRMRVAAAGGTAFFLALAGTASASASTGDTTPSVVNREVVQADLDSAGKLDVARLFSQLSVVGKGTVDIADPTSSKGLRNLDGFGKPTVRDGKAIYTIHVDGSTSRRTVSDYTKTLPVTVNATYTLGGKAVRAKDIVGKTGDVTATYTVTNVSGSPTPVSWQDGKGVTHTETINLVTPLVGQIQTTLPGSYTDLATPAADVAADGRGGSILTYSMVLFSPIGNETQTFSWSGHVKDGVVPAVEIQILPASPTQKPELNTGVIGYRDGAKDATELTVGAGQIDANLLKLQNGAGDLLAGLTKLAAGAADLQSGLAGDAAPGAKKLAAGAADAKAGAADLSSGLGDLSAGASDLSGGLSDAKTGSGSLAEGIAQILAGVKSLPTDIAADPAYQQLLGALAAVQAGIGSASDVTPTTLLGGLNLLGYGLRSPLGVHGCDPTAAAGTPTSCGAADAVELVQEQLADAVAPGHALDQLIGAAKLAYSQAGCTAAPAGVPVTGVLPPSLVPGTDPGACVYISNLAYGLGLPAAADPAHLGGLKAQTTTAAGVLGAVFAGIDDSIIPGISQVKLGLSNPACSLSNPTNPANPCGIKQVQGLVSAGIGQLVQAISTSLADVLGQASSGAVALDSGLAQLDAGGSQLADGAAQAADGAGQLDSGLGQISSGATALSDGITKAADGSKQLADGLNSAKAGDTQIVSGAGRLRSEGTSALVAGGSSTAGDAAKKYATLIALSDKVGANALPYGAPEGATGSAAYQFTLAAADTTSHDNRDRAVVAGLLLIAACAVSWLLRRRMSTR